MLKLICKKDKNMKSKINFYGGLNTLVGVVISITYNKKRILLKIRTAYNPIFDIHSTLVL